ncbi:hypothetical protein D3C86_2103790 [compost metagenome]
MVFSVVALVFQANRNARVEERQFTQALGQDVVLKLDVIGEGLEARPEAQGGTGLIGFTDHFQRGLWFAMLVGLLMDLAFAADHQLQLF